VHAAEINSQETEALRQNKLCELNVRQQVANVCRSVVVQNAWKNKAKLSVHGWVYHLSDGLLCNLIKPVCYITTHCSSLLGRSLHVFLI
jgi:carbonic anhydrase